MTIDRFFIRSVLSQFSLGILVLLVFFGVFKGLQDNRVYESSLGRISDNYQRIGTFNDQTITKSTEPYNEISNENLSNWDAAIYRCVSELMYQPSLDCYGSVRGAFFPLFPLIWRVTNLDARGVCLLNYLLFIISISALTQLFLKTSPLKMNLVYLALITLPSSIVFFIPYTESFFLTTMTIAIFGIVRKKYWVYFIGIVLMSMVRPATLFILIAILVLETHDFLKHYNLKRSLIEMRHKASPFLLGYFLTFLLQYSSSGNWTTYLDAAKSWEGGLKSFNTITDWSVEGFGLSIFALCFVSVPILFYLLTLVKKRPDELTFSFREGESSDPKDSLTIISCLYLSGIFLFTLLTSGGNLHGFFRFTLCSPLFYVLLLMAIHHVAINRAWKYHLGIFLSAILFFIVLDQIAYGGSRTTFSLIGPLLYLAYFIYLSLPMRTSALRIISLFILIACSIVWNSYLLNILLSNGYIYT